MLEQKTFRDGTHRVIDPSTTLTRLMPKLATAGITRVADVTGLDTIGVPVVMSVRPMSRSLSVQQGKGVTLDAAKTSAIMESIESFCAEQVPPDARRGRAGDFAPHEVLFPKHLLRRRWRPSDDMPWVLGTDLLTTEEVFVPEELVTLDLTRPIRDGYGWFASSSCGLAAGNTSAEATLHAVCEVIERESVGLWRQASRSARAQMRINPDDFDNDWVRTLMRRYKAARMSVAVWDVTSIFNVPAFHCYIDDQDAFPPFLGRFAGSGCHPDAAVALGRALSEAAQSRLTLIVGARDDLGPEYYAGISWDQNLASLMTAGESILDRNTFPVRAASFASDSITADLSETLERIGQTNRGRIVRVDISDPKLSEHCVRVIAPDLAKSGPAAPEVTS